MDETQLIHATAEFLKRTTLRGDEVPTFNAIHNWLNQRLADAAKKAQRAAERAAREATTGD